MSIKEAIKKIIPRAILDVIDAHYRIKHHENISNRNSEIIRELLKGSMPIKLEIGAGKNRGVEGWTYSDMGDGCDLNLDLRNPLPFPDNTVSMIYSSHVLEHFSYRDMNALLTECFRILKSGGVFSAALPNARIYIEAYLTPDKFDPEVYCRYRPAYNYNSKIDFLNYMAYMNGHHRHMFDEESIIAILKRAGFRIARLRSFDETLDMKERDYESIYVLAEK
jgi:predicted SAM-dependent methyltransferase